MGTSSGFAEKRLHPSALTHDDASQTMWIKVKTLTGKELKIDIEPEDDILHIKQKVEEIEGIPPEQQRLVFAGKQMTDALSAKEYSIEPGSTLHLVLAMRGGC